MFTADFWYRHSSDPDRSVRANPQMLAPVADERAAAKIVAEMREQGYTVQRVLLHATCGTCEGRGRIGKRPKGVRRRKSLPSWMLTYHDCAACEGHGFLSKHEMPLDAAEET